ncbi:MAG: GWxTD domain-containing protein [Candidatus Saccharicenans sp.]
MTKKKNQNESVRLKKLKKMKARNICPRGSRPVLFCLILILTWTGLINPLYSQSEKDLLKTLTPAQKEWLEIVTPIITEAEKQVFLKLKTEQERDRFINLFWKIRDPNPETNENEFYREYLERVHYADNYFSIGSSKRGCLTERGYYYLLLGKPLERQVFATYSDIWPMELWFYKGDPKYGLPGYFYLLFYQPQGVGDYRLYYPGVEGPEKLVIPALTRETLTRSKALEIIKTINSELAKAAVSLLPEDRADTFSSLSSQSIIAAIKSLPEKQFATDYARHYLSFKDLVEVDYSHNYLPCQGMAKVLKNGDNFFIHWSIEPEKINLAENNGIYSAYFELVIRVEDNAGHLVLSRTEEIPLRFNQKQFEEHSRQRFALQDLLPILPGDYKLLILLKNKTGKDFTSWETNLQVPQVNDKRSLGTIILYHSRADLPAGKMKAFSAGRSELLVSARNEFSPSEKLQVFGQLLSSDSSLLAEGRVQLCIKSLESPDWKQYQERALKDVLNSDFGMFFDSIDLSQVKPGYYQVELTLSRQGRVLDRQKENFIVLNVPVLTAPWVYSRLYNQGAAINFSKMLASQYFLKGEYKKAADLCELILKSQEDTETRLLLGKALYGAGEYYKSIEMVRPVYESSKNREAGKVLALDYAALKDWSTTLYYLEQLLSEATEIGVLNLAGQAYENLGDKEKAIKAYERSLSLLPDQTDIKRRLESLKK